MHKAAEDGRSRAGARTQTLGFLAAPGQQRCLGSCAGSAGVVVDGCGICPGRSVPGPCKSSYCEGASSSWQAGGVPVGPSGSVG